MINVEKLVWEIRAKKQIKNVLGRESIQFNIFRFLEITSKTFILFSGFCVTPWILDGGI